MGPREMSSWHYKDEIIATSDTKMKLVEVQLENKQRMTSRNCGIVIGVVFLVIL